jgi:superfamily II DNA or RNA helicase
MSSSSTPTGPEPSLRDSRIVSDAYEDPQTSIAAQVLVPCFRTARAVRGAFGFFSSGALRVLAPGLAQYLSRTDNAPIRLVISPMLSEEDITAISKGVREPREIAERRLAEVLEDTTLAASALARHAAACLGWLLAAGRLELLVAIPRDGKKFHKKIWEFHDGEDYVIVRGSSNATEWAMTGNFEQMDVDTTWDGSGRKIATYVRMLDSYFDPLFQRRDLDLYAAPAAVRDGLLKARRFDERPSDESLATAERQDVKSHPVRAGKPGLRIPASIEWRTGIYAYQGDAVKEWEKAGRRGVFEMATGAGKTIAALVAASRASAETEDPFLLVVAVPTNALAAQWRDEVEAFGLDPVCPTVLPSARKWRAIQDLLKDLRYEGGVACLIVTFDLLKDLDFCRLISAVRARRMLIGDEVHGLGTERFLSATPEFFEYRLGLSATFVRQYDDEGTEALSRYFGPKVYGFGLDRAVGFCLVNYDYFVHTVELAGEELDQYLEVTEKLSKSMAIRGADDPSVALLAIRRHAILENAAAKVPALEQELRKSAPNGIDHTLIFVSAKNPLQMDRVNAVMISLREAFGEGFSFRQVTDDESGDPALLRQILSDFQTGKRRVLTSKKVLDEGINIPEIHTAHILASSTVEREWVQRRGRVLRRAPGKEFATIHDYVVLPPKDLPSDPTLRRLLRKELDRIEAFGRFSRNVGQPHSASWAATRIIQSYFSKDS